MARDADQNPAKKWREGEGDQRDRERCDEHPEKEGVPLPLPELTGEVEGMFAGCAQKFARREWHGGSVEDAAGDMDERNDQNELERVDDVVA